MLVYVFYCFSQFTSCARWFMTMNYFVHSLMYTYFALRAMRWERKNLKSNYF